MAITSLFFVMGGTRLGCSFVGLRKLVLGEARQDVLVTVDTAQDLLRDICRLIFAVETREFGGTPQAVVVCLHLAFCVFKGFRNRL